MLFVELVITLILSSILPNVCAITMHDSVLKLTLEVAAISPLEASKSTHLVIGPDASVLASVCPEVNAFSFFDTLLEVAMVVAAIGPDFDTFPILLLHRSHFRLRLDCIEIILYIKALVLSEDTQVCVSIRLPEALVYLFCLT